MESENIYFLYNFESKFSKSKKYTISTQYL